MSPRRDVSEERREQILNTAMNVFARLGMHDARMDDIASESGLSKGALYWYFKSKDEIITALVTSLFEGEMSALRKLLDTEGSVTERLTRFIDDSVASLMPMLRLRPLVYEFYALSIRQAAVRQSLSQYFRGYLDVVVPLIEQGIARGEFRPMDAREVAIAFASIYEGTMLLWAYAPESIDLQRHIQTSVRLLLQGLTP